ncbi:MAG: type II secretion system protein GspD [Gammaproteobacteria bacterium]|nr:type II secretion system protein GspD [Gammaproteobacteria bacterium]
MRGVRCFALGCCLSVVSLAPVRVGADGLALSLDNADLIELVQWASELTDKAIIVHPDVRGEVTVIAGDPMTRAEAYDVFLSVLRVHGYAVVEDAESLRILPADRARREGLPVQGADGGSAASDMAIHVVRLENVKVDSVVGLLQPLTSPAAHLAAYPSGNLLLIADRSGNVTPLLEIIGQMDRAGSAEFELIELNHAAAGELAGVVERLLPPSEQALSPLRIGVAERANAILLTGDVADRERVRQLIERLDRAPEAAAGTQVFRLQYASAAEVAPVLRTVAATLSAREPGPSAPEVVIGVLEGLNAVVVSAPASVAAAIRAVLTEVDLPRAQVLVEAIIVEVSQESAIELGVEWTSDGVSGQSGTVGGFSFFPSGVSPLSVDRDGGVSLGTGLSVGQVRDGDLRTLFNALSSDSDANILSTPTIMTLDNQEASILVGSNVPFITGSESQDNGNPFTTVQREDIGIELRVRPQVNNDEWVTLTIQQSVESISTSAVAASDIITNKREIDTRVMVRSGSTLVLGGLVRDEAAETRRKIPVLGDIPLLGAAFRSTDTSVNKRNLMVFIRPLIIRDAPSLDRVTRAGYERVRREQRGFQSPGDFYWILGESAPLLEPLPEGPGGEAAAP